MRNARVFKEADALRQMSQRNAISLNQCFKALIDSFGFDGSAVVSAGCSALAQYAVEKSLPIARIHDMLDEVYEGICKHRDEVSKPKRIVELPPGSKVN